MKKLTILMLVLGFASSANAYFIHLRADHLLPEPPGVTVTLTPDKDTVRISVYCDMNDVPYSVIFTVNNDGTTSGLGEFGPMNPSPIEPLGEVTNPYYGCDWAYLLEKGVDEPPPVEIPGGEHFWINYTATLFDGSQQIVNLRDHDAAWSLIETVSITQVPEPVTIALLGLGSLLLLRRRK